MKKTINKWDVVSPTQQKIGKILKVLAAVTFLSVWLPAMVYITSEIFKLIF
jgi:hypothetical protein